MREATTGGVHKEGSLDVTRERALAVYYILETELGASAASREHFVEKWLHARDGYFAYAVGPTEYTFRVEPDRWYVTSWTREVYVPTLEALHRAQPERQEAA